MNITREQVDALNAIVKVAVAKEDYTEKVEKVLADYKKNASLPGFRKGAVPMSLIKKQYEKAVMADEVNKLLQESLNNYLVEEKLDILGNPLPKVTEDFSWDAEELTFEFELGLAPDFKVDLSAKNSIIDYKIIADDALLDEQVERIQKQYGKLIPQEVVAEGNEVKGTFVNEEKGINNTTVVTSDIFKDKKAAKALEGKKIGDVVTVKTKGLFDDDDKLFGEGAVTSVEDLKAKIKEDAEAQFAQQADQKFLNDVTDFLIESTKFDLPETFLKKWIKTVTETPLTDEQAEEEFAKAEKGLRFQLIEGKVMAENNLQITFEDLKAHTAELIKKQMAQFGQLNPSEDEINGIVARVMSNQDEVKRLSEQVMSEKMLGLYKEKVKAKTKEVNYEQFIKEMYGE